LPVIWTKWIQNLDLFNYSYLTNPISYVKKATKITKLKQNLKNKFLIKQRKKYLLCNQKLIN
jgi:hypothetical protein